jgi:hypothetical protein
LIIIAVLGIAILLAILIVGVIFLTNNSEQPNTNSTPMPTAVPTNPPTSTPKPTPYVGVDYVLADWALSFDTSYTVYLNVTITNNGYSDAVQYPVFKLTVNNVTYNGIAFSGNLIGTSVSSGGTISGEIAFYGVPDAQTSFSLDCSMYFENNIFSRPTISYTVNKHAF